MLGFLCMDMTFPLSASLWEPTTECQPHDWKIHDLVIWSTSVVLRAPWFSELVSRNFTRRTSFFWNMMPRHWLIRPDIPSSTVKRSEKNYFTLLCVLTPCLTLWGSITLLHYQTAWPYCITWLAILLHDPNLWPCAMTVLRRWKEHVVTTRLYVCV